MIAKSLFLYDICLSRCVIYRMLKISSNILSTCLGTPYHRLSNPFENPGIITYSLAGVRSVLVQSLYVVKKNQIYKRS
jgi:hypothetical protein